MITEELLQIFLRSRPAQAFLQAYSAESPLYAKGLAGSLKAFLLAGLFREGAGQLVYFSRNPVANEELKEDLELLVGSEMVHFYPHSASHRRAVGLSPDVLKELRLAALESLVQKKRGIVICHSSALVEKLPAPQHFETESLLFSTGDSTDFEDAVARLNDLGFVRESRVEQRGELCVRGGIIDVFPFTARMPFRLEFWGNRVESIRQFDPVTQRSTARVQQLRVYPQDEQLLLGGETAAATLLDYVDERATVVLDEPEIIRKELAEVSCRGSGVVAKKESGLPEGVNDFDSEISRFKQIRLVSVGSAYDPLIDLGGRSPESFAGNLKRLKEYISSAGKSQSASPPGRAAAGIYFLCDTEAQTERIRTIFTEEDIVAGNFYIRTLGLHHGFVYPAGDLTVFTDHEFYGRPKRLRAVRRRARGLSRKQLEKLNIGDYVVHVDYGIGKYLGLKKIAVRGHEHECLSLEYKDKDRVYVRVEYMNRVNKYSSKDGAQPALSKLGSPDWQRMKSRTKKKIQDIARELIEIYAKRKATEGFAFSHDSLWQKELEASFPFEDTPDQIKATRDVKEDMESPRPMDRLVCGDVGFGKTEIAVRAAFKAIENGKQVAMLVPTTILAYQHYNTFMDRLEKFPVRVEMLSRFKTRKQQQEIIRKLREGKIDIVIGTHRLLSKDVQFADLGLLVIDEEQRFGVAHKEKLKKLRVNVDVLTLTATPIPRTLQFSLMGARDMTNINTPPKNRLPIVTEILPFHREYIRTAILRELERGGQVFFVHNRVRTIEKLAGMIRRLVPEAEVAVAHGQMHERELERIMIDFMSRKFDILVATMIIESGLDIPNVNTIIVDHADKLGLAQLYQLRGRVGRSHQRAYAYLLIPPIETLTDEARKRLHAIEEFSEIGSGARLAMRDLEIRGAGNLLGAEQTGFIDALGFELYHKILDEAIKELQAEHLPEKEKQPDFETKVDIAFDAYLPEDYIASGTERIDIYKRLTEAQALTDVANIAEELRDRFGNPPEEVSNLLQFISLRILGKKLFLDHIRVDREEMIGKFIPEVLTLPGEQFKSWLGSMLEQTNEPFEFIQDHGLALKLRFRDEGAEPLSLASKFLQSLASNGQPEIRFPTEVENVEN